MEYQEKNYRKKNQSNIENHSDSKINLAVYTLKSKIEKFALAHAFKIIHLSCIIQQLPLALLFNFIKVGWAHWRNIITVFHLQRDRFPLE